MGLSHELISQFAKVVKDNKKQNSEHTVYGQVVTDGNGNKYVKLDGSDQLTPLTDENRPSVDTATANVKEGDRVSVLIKNHTATVTGNVSSPAVRNEDFDSAITEIKETNMLLANRIQANEGYIQELRSDKASVGELNAANAKITDLETNKASIGELNAANAKITDLETNKLSADAADIKYATIGSLNATSANIDKLSAKHSKFETATANNFEAVNGSISNLDAKYANINFSNIGEAAIRKLFSDTGMINDLIVDNGTVTGEIVGVTIRGDRIIAGTIAADKIVIRGDDGILYKLNTDGLTEKDIQELEKDETDTETLKNSIHGSKIIADTITAEKVRVDDLVAFGATIGGLNIIDGSIHSGVKSSIDSTTKGFYLDKDGQFIVGDLNNFIKYYKDQNGNYKLEISANDISIRSEDSTKSIETAINDILTKQNGFVSDINSINETVSQLKFDSDNVDITIKNIINDGVSSVTTTNGYSFTNEGLKVTKSDSDLKTTITENGMTVSKDDTDLLTANDKGVMAKDLNASTYLIIGGRSRFENYKTDRTGCFWIGG